MPGLVPLLKGGYKLFSPNHSRIVKMGWKLPYGRLLPKLSNIADKCPTGEAMLDILPLQLCSWGHKGLRPVPQGIKV